ncbi:MAG: sigma-54 dependent transcriptional regulator [Bacteroidota bacterium]|nr:sigma-54 dependent transcriptional regulator [Bacteroidota bacterium]
MFKLTILAVDDEANQRKILAGYLKKKGYNVIEANSAEQGIELANKNLVDLILTDFKMPGKTGVDLLKEVRAKNPEAAIVIMTAFGTIESAVEAMRAGAYDYITKPIDFDELELLIQRLGERQQLISENILLKEQLAEKYKFTDIIAHSHKMEEVLNLTGRVAKSRASVLIRGESGTGKELIARAIHFASQRHNKPFIAVNCSALNENLLESELFGHEKGAYTSADKQRLGRFELADGGTIFLDEIGDIPLSTQVKLLRVLQEQNFERVGGSQSIQVDVRVIAATNRNLEEFMKEGKFREDLFYRLNVVTIEIPPLNQRKEDILPLVEYFKDKYSKEVNKDKVEFSKEALDTLLKYHYPGNVRELENIIHRAVVLVRENLITTNELPINLRSLPSEQPSSTSTQSQNLGERVEELEKELIFEALQKTDGNQSKAALLLGISERNLRYKLEKLGLKKYSMK